MPGRSTTITAAATVSTSHRIRKSFMASILCHPGRHRSVAMCRFGAFIICRARSSRTIALKGTIAHLKTQTTLSRLRRQLPPAGASMQLQYDVRAEIVDYVPRILRLPCKQEDDDDYKGNGGGDHDEAGGRPATGVRATGRDLPLRSHPATALAKGATRRDGPNAEAECHRHRPCGTRRPGQTRRGDRADGNRAGAR